MYTFNISLCSFLRLCWKKDYHHCWWTVVWSRWNIADCSIFLVVSAHMFIMQPCMNVTPLLSIYRMMFVGRFIGGLGVG